jgi:hypothetical protein
MAETANGFPGMVETFKYEIGGVYERTVEVKQDRSRLFIQLAYPLANFFTDAL